MASLAIFVHDFTQGTDSSNASITAVVGDSTVVTDPVNIQIVGVGIEFFDGFDYGNVMSSRYDFDSGGVVGTTGGRYGTGVAERFDRTTFRLLALGTTGSSRGLLSTSISKTVGFAIENIGSTLGTMFLVSFFDGATVQCELVVDGNGFLTFYRGALGTILGVSPTAIRNGGIWYYIEVVVTIGSGSSGSFNVLVNGLSMFQGQGVNTQTTANSYINGVAFNRTSGIGAGEVYEIDDIYIRNDTTFMGEVICQGDEPISDGDTTQWTPNSGANHFSRLNSADGDTSYDFDSSIGDLDLVGYSAFSSNGGVVRAVQNVFAARKDNAGNIDIGGIIKTGGIAVMGPSVGGLNTSYQYFAYPLVTNPNPPRPWSDSDVSSVQMGAKVLGTLYINVFDSSAIAESFSPVRF